MCAFFVQELYMYMYIYIYMYIYVQSNRVWNLVTSSKILIYMGPHEGYINIIIKWKLVTAIANTCNYKYRGSSFLHMGVKSSVRDVLAFRLRSCLVLTSNPPVCVVAIEVR